MQIRPIKLGEPLELTIRARGTLLSVAVNGEHILAYRLPIPRKAGDLRLITFTAQSEFLAFELATLPGEVALVDPAAPGGNKPVTVEQARAAVAVAEKTLA